jgi:hypothetical protein
MLLHEFEWRKEVFLASKPALVHCDQADSEVPGK